MDVVPDVALLSAAIAMADPAADSDALAARLLCNASDLNEAVTALIRGAMKPQGLAPEAAVRFRAIVALAARLVRPALVRHPVFLEHDALVTYCRLRAACSASVQTIRVLFLDAARRLIADEVHQTGTAGAVEIFVRDILRRALEWGAYGLVVAHSAPGCMPPVAVESRRASADLQEAGAALGIALHEYLLIGGGSYRCLVRKAEGRAKATVGT